MSPNLIYIFIHSLSSHKTQTKKNESRLPQKMKIYFKTVSEYLTLQVDTATHIENVILADGVGTIE